jgi:Na+(H+)/acetate symporter ActP
MIPDPRPTPPLSASLGISAMIIVGLSGALIVQGHDGLAYLLGILGAAYLANMVVAPSLRARGQGTRGTSLPDVLAHQTNSPAVGQLVKVIIVVATVGILASEINALASVFGSVAGVQPAGAMGLATTALLAGVAMFAPRGATTTTPQSARREVIVAVVAIAAVLAATLVVFDIGRSLGSSLLLEPALADIAKLEQSLVEKRMVDPASLKPHATPFLRTDINNFIGLIGCLAGGLALLWPLRASSSNRRFPAASYLALTALMLALTSFAAAAKRALLTAFDVGIRPNALPDWLSRAMTLDIIQLCGTANSDPVALKAACGRGVGPQGYLRWNDAVFVQDSLAIISLDAAKAPNAILWLLALAALIGAILATSSMTMNLARSTSPVNSATRTRGVLCGLGLVALAGCVALARPGDSLTLVTWSASFVIAALGPSVITGGRSGPRATALAIVAGAVVTVVLIGSARWFPLAVADWTGALVNAPPAVLKRIATLREVAADPAKREMLQAAERLARDHILWLGLKPHIAGLWGSLVGLAILGVSQCLCIVRAQIS